MNIYCAGPYEQLVGYVMGTQLRKLICNCQLKYKTRKSRDAMRLKPLAFCQIQDIMYYLFLYLGILSQGIHVSLSTT